MGHLRHWQSQETTISLRLKHQRENVPEAQGLGPPRKCKNHDSLYKEIKNPPAAAPAA